MEAIKELETNIDTKVSKVDKWKYNDILNDLARRTLIAKGSVYFGENVLKFITALKPISTDKLPIKQRLAAAETILSERFYWSKIDELKKINAIWNHPLKRGIMEEEWKDDFFVAYFDYALDVATAAGFTIQLENIHEGTGIRG